MQTHHVFFRACEDAKGKETKVRNKQTKEVVANVYDYFKELNRFKRTQESLKQTSDVDILKTHLPPQLQV